MSRWFRSLFAWRVVERNNHWEYAENAVTGARRLRRHNYTVGWPPAPPDLGWVEQGLPFGEIDRRRRSPPPACDD